MGCILSRHMHKTKGLKHPADKDKVENPDKSTDENTRLLADSPGTNPPPKMVPRSAGNRRIPKLRDPYSLRLPNMVRKENYLFGDCANDSDGETVYEYVNETSGSEYSDEDEEDDYPQDEGIGHPYPGENLSQLAILRALSRLEVTRNAAAAAVERAAAVAAEVKEKDNGGEGSSKSDQKY